MGSKVKSRIQELIQDLDEHAPHGGAPTASQRLGDEASEVSLGLSSDASDDQAAGLHAVMPAGLAKGAHKHVTELEAKVMELLQERKQAALRHERELRAKDAEVLRMQQYIDADLRHLQQRQEEVEARAPLLQMQMQEAREALRDLTISDATYAQLKRVPDGRLLLVDAVKVAVYEATQQLAGDNERLRLAGASSREAAQRLEDDNERLRRDNARMAAGVADRDADAYASMAALEARVQRLSAELEEAAMQVEVLHAKGQMYDQLQAQAESLEEQVSRMGGVETAARRLQAQLAEADGLAREREHTLELLLADKAYLGQQVELLGERAAAAEAQAAEGKEKVAELKAARAELYRKLYEAEASVRTEAEGRVAGEVSRLQALATADLERIRRESADASEREVRLLRELRDQAQEEASAAKVELRQLRADHEDLLTARREAVGRAEARIAELQAELKVKAFEAQRLQALAEERGAALSQAQLQVGLLSDKVHLLTDGLHAAEAESKEQLRELSQQLEGTRAQLAVLQGEDAGEVAAMLRMAGAAGGSSAAAGVGEGAGAGASEGAPAGLSAAAQRRVQHNLQLASRCARLEADKGTLARRVEQLSAQLAAAEEEAVRAREQLRGVSQPHAFLLRQLQAAEERVRAAEVHAAEMQEAAQATAASVLQADHERTALKRDLERILQERGILDSLRTLVVTSMGAAQPAAAHQPSGAVPYPQAIQGA